MSDEFLPMEQAPDFDGATVVLKINLTVPAFWCADLCKWLLDRERLVDSLPRYAPDGWKPRALLWKTIPHEGKVNDQDVKA